MFLPIIEAVKDPQAEYGISILVSDLRSQTEGG